MYHQIVERKIRRGFENLSSGDFEPVLSQFSPRVHFSFAGDHVLGGECHTVQGVRQWFQRLSRVFPGLQFTIHNIVVSGWPWNTFAANHFSVQMAYPDGRIYQNSGVQLVRLRWGRVVEDYVLEDTQKLASELQLLARKGLQEALAAPIAD